MRNYYFSFSIIFFVALLTGLHARPSFAVLQQPQAVYKVSLNEALEKALKNNHRRPASRFAVAMAEAQHRQALAVYWPQLSVQGTWQHFDESPDFITPNSFYTFPELPISLPGGTSLTLNTPQGFQAIKQLSTSELTVVTPSQEFPLMDKESVHVSLQAQWLVYDGGKRKGYSEQTQARLEMMRQEARRTDLEIIDSVTRYYYGAILARQLHQIGVDTLSRMEVTLGFTESMYKTSSGNVKKTDWLNTQIVVESLRALVAQLEKNELMAQAALANIMGLSWSASVCPVDDVIPFTPSIVSLEDLVGSSYQFNPDWVKIKQGLRAAQGAMRTAKSGYFPKIAVTGELRRCWSEHHIGMDTEGNEESWSVGVGIEIPLFDGFLTKARIAESDARIARLKEQQILFKEGLGLQIRDIFLSLTTAAKIHEANYAAMKASAENRKLNARAYQHGLVETEDVIRAQLVSAFMTARHYKAHFDHIALQSQLNMVVGTRVCEILKGG